MGGNFSRFLSNLIELEESLGLVSGMIPADIHTIQKLMGHPSIHSTLRYFHLAQVKLLGTRSPLDLLEQVPTPEEEIPESLG